MNKLCLHFLLVRRIVFSDISKKTTVDDIDENVSYISCERDRIDFIGELALGTRSEVLKTQIGYSTTKRQIYRFSCILRYLASM